MSTVFTIFFVYNDDVLILKQEFISIIPDYMIPVDCFQNNKHVINFISNDMTSKFEAFINHKPDTLYITESTRTEWLQVLYEYWYE